MTGSCAANKQGTIQVNGDAGTIHSLNYPSYHPDTMTCQWDITVKAGQVIELIAITHQLDKDCSRVYLRIYDGPSTSSPELVKLCASNNPQSTFFTSSNSAIIEFVSKNSQNSKGFFVTYAARMAKPKPYACSENKWTTNINTFTAKIASDRFPLRYSNDAKCLIRIKLPKINYLINLTFTTFELEPDGDKCDKDFVRIQSNGYKLANLCGKKNTPLSFLSKNSNDMTIQFWANEVGRYPGFEASFGSIMDSKYSAVLF